MRTDMTYGERNTRILIDRANGKTLQKIGDEYGITKNTVRMIIKMYEIRGPNAYWDKQIT